MRKKILFITGSLNQTSQMHKIAQHLDDYDCWFSQFFTDSRFGNFLIQHTSLLNNTIFSGQFRQNSEKYLKVNGLKTDYGAQKNKYDLVVYCSDMHIPKRMRQNKLVWVQEGMTDRHTFLTTIINKLKLPPILAGGTSLNGSSNICDVYCAGSEAYKRQFTRLGTDQKKIVITGIPNYDNVAQFLDNDFPYKDYVMVATTDMRETYSFENRPAFIRRAVKIANGRKLLFKLHPNENFERAEAEIRKYAPCGTLIFRTGNTNHMVANCSELITQYSTVVYIGLALGKKVHSYFDVEELNKLAPVQNGGRSAYNIAQICRGLMPVKELTIPASEYELEPDLH